MISDDFVVIRLWYIGISLSDLFPMYGLAEPGQSPGPRQCCPCRVLGSAVGRLLVGVSDSLHR